MDGADGVDRLLIDRPVLFSEGSLSVPHCEANETCIGTAGLHVLRPKPSSVCIWQPSGFH